VDISREVESDATLLHWQAGLIVRTILQVGAHHFAGTADEF
jgi:hypothetical protein